ncbi:MAG: hypothetical protein Q9159_001996 [Coniocarpon cinnabarinum]
MSKSYVPSARLLRVLSQPPYGSITNRTCLRCQRRYLSAGASRLEKQYLTPEPNQNTGRDTRTLSQRRDDFASYDKHKQRQSKLLSDVFERNYWRDVGNLGKVHKGKSILAPSTPFKRGVALYFPNLEGMTLEGRGVGWGKKWAQTTQVLQGKVSLVGMVHTTWAAEQVRSFLSPEKNPALKEAVETHAGAKELVQQVTVNVEENPLKAFMVRLFFGNVRRSLPKERWGTYFLNRRGLSEDLRDALAMWNSKVGYVYLLDGECRVRWAANGEARPEERESLVRCVRRLVDEARGVQKGVKREEPRPSSKEQSQKDPVQRREKQTLAAS